MKQNETGREEAKSAGQTQPAQSGERAAAETVDAGAENFEHTIRRLFIRKHGLQSKPHGKTPPKRA